MQPAIPKEIRMRFTDILAIGTALLALVVSVYLWFGGQRDEGLFVGIWVPSILAFASFVKLATWRNR
jgi:hypothetical protein